MSILISGPSGIFVYCLLFFWFRVFWSWLQVGFVIFDWWLLYTKSSRCSGWCYLYYSVFIFLFLGRQVIYKQMTSVSSKIDRICSMVSDVLRVSIFLAHFILGAWPLRILVESLLCLPRLLFFSGHWNSVFVSLVFWDCWQLCLSF